MATMTALTEATRRTATIHAPMGVSAAVLQMLMIGSSVRSAHGLMKNVTDMPIARIIPTKRTATAREQRGAA